MTEQLHELERDDEQGRSQARRLLQIAWRRKALIVLGLVAGLVIGVLYYAQRPAIYQANAMVLVVKKRPDALPMSSLDTRYASLAPTDDYLATHVVLIKSPVIVSRAVQKRELANLRSFKHQGDPAAIIPVTLTVTRDAKEPGGSASNVLYLSYRAPVQEDCAAVLTAVIDSYHEFLEQTYRSMSDETVRLITEARNYLRKDLKEKEAAYRQFRQKAPLVWKGKDGTHGQHERLASINAKRSALLVQRAETEARLATLDQAIQSGRSPAALRALVADLANKTAPDAQRSPQKTIEEQLLPLLLQEQELLEDYGPDHPRVISVRKRIAFVRNYAAELTGVNDADAKGAGDERLRLRDPVNRYRLSLLQQLEELKAQESQLDAVFKTEQDQVKSLMQFELDEEALRNEVTRTQQLYDSIIKRLQEIDLGKDSGGFEARVISPPLSIGRVEPKVLPILAVALVLGLLVGGGLAYFAEIFDQSFRSPDEIRQRLGLPLVGHIPMLKPDQPAAAALDGVRLDPLLVSYHHPRSVEAEAYRGVRTSLYFSTRGEGHKVIQITSPSQGEGKSTLAANLAVSIAQSGKRVLLIDGDLRRPRLHGMLGVSNGAGLSGVIAGDLDWQPALQATIVPGLSLLPAGLPPTNPAELLTSPRFQELMAAVHEAYDFVLIDTPPLLAVTDPCAVAPRADGVLLTLRLSKYGRPRAERACEVLQTLGAQIFGVVVNGLSRRGGPGSYGYTQDSYRYETDYAEGRLEDIDLAGYYPADGAPPTNGNGHPARTSVQEGVRGFWRRLLNR